MYEIRYKYPGEPWETIDEADTEEEAKQYVNEYRAAFHGEGIVTYRRKREDN